MEKDKTTKQRLEERFPSDETIEAFSPYDCVEPNSTDKAFHKVWCNSSKWMRSQCLTASEELIQKEIEERDKLLEEMVSQLVSLKSHWRRSGDDINMPSSLMSGINKSISNYSDFLKGKEQ